jgi:hypothetical protein
VSLTVSGLPDGTTASFSPSQVSAANPAAVLTLTSAGTPGGDYSIVVTATTADSTRSRSATFDLTLSGQAQPGGN